MHTHERQSNQACIVHNPFAGRGRGGRLRERLQRAARRLGWEVDVRSTRRAGHEVELAAEARLEGWPVVVAAGGDGTVHGVANGLLADGPTDVTLGHVPHGTGNDFAKLLGLRRGPIERNLPLILRGRERRFDVGSALGEHFLNTLGVGFSAEVVRQLSGFAQPRGFGLYLAAVYRTFFGFRPPTLRVVTGDYDETGPLMMLEVGIGTTAGGGFRLLPDAQPDDGELDVCVIRRVGLLEFLRYVPRVVRGTHTRLDPVDMLRTARIRVESRGEPLTVHLDGELRLPGERSVEISVEPKHLRVLCAPY
ncbi:MAG: diacylglycerol/lipid kinase family protein [Gemmatimonadales bacterium]